MKKVSLFLFANLLMLSLAVPQAIPQIRVRLSPSSTGKQVATHYFYWYRYPDMHFVDPDGSDALTHHPPATYLMPPPAYSFADAGWHYRELGDLMDAGIDIILPVYWGDYTNIIWSQTGLVKLVEAENRLISEGKNPPKIGMFYDTTALWIQNGNQPADLTTLAGKQMFFKMIKDFFDRVPVSLWARIGGKPLIVLYGAQYASHYNQSTFDYVKAQFALTYSGETPYIIKESSWEGVATDGEYTWGAAAFGVNIHGDVAELGPGYDDSAVYGRNPPTYRDRECGEFYKDGWEQVSDSAATLTIIETWNEFHEGSEVAPTAEYNRQYLNLTAQNALAWKAAPIVPRPYAWVDLGRFQYAKGISAPNLGDGTWRTIYLGGRQAAYPDKSSTPDPSYHIYLNVDDAYILGQNNLPTHIWVVVEYFDLGYSGWFLQYDSVGPDEIPYVFKGTDWVMLHNTQQWKRITFDLPDAYFANRQQGGLSDLRLVAGYDGGIAYFGRVWVFKTNPGLLNPPNLTGLQDLVLRPNSEVEVPLVVSKTGGGVVTLSLDRAPGFVSLLEQGGGAYLLRLAPTLADASPCTYRVRLLAADTSSPALYDAETIAVNVFANTLYLPLERR